MEETEEISSKKSSVGPSSTLEYLNPRYWDERFSTEEHYEWFKDYSHFQHLIKEHVKPTSSVLELGCGNSQLCEKLYNDGVTELTCIDISAVAVEKMQKRLLSKGYPDIRVVEADMLDLPFGDESFDVVIEKGTMPHFRRPIFCAPDFNWSMEWSTFGDGFHYFFYILKKGQKLPDTNLYTEKIDTPSISMFHDELDNEDYIFRTNLDEMEN